MRIAPVLLAGLGFLVGTASATAGPIWIHYQVDSTANPAPVAGGGYGNFELHNAGQLSADAPGLMARFNFLPSAPLPPSDWTPPGGGTFDGVTRFTVNVQVTDDASGESGTIHLIGSATSPWARTSADLVPGATFVFDGDSLQTLTLGGHTFDVSAAGASDPNGGNVRAYVSISLEGSNVLQSPEPCTLLLAGVGLVGAIGLKARRRAEARLSS
jgi:hypothetical protein